MNDQQSFEREVATWMTAEGATSTPDQTLDDILISTSRERPLPRWLELTKEPPMRISSSLAVGSPTVRVAAIMFATLLITLAVAGAGIAGSRLLAFDGTIVVDQSGNGTVTTITEAVAMAADGDTILVQPGTYDESVVIAKNVTIRSEGDREDVVIDVSAEMSAFAQAFDPDLLMAFQLESSNATIENVTLRGDSSMIVILGGAPTLRNLMLDGIGRVYGVDPGVTSVPTGIGISGGSSATIVGSELAAVDIAIDTGSSPTVRGNVMTVGSIFTEGAGVDPIIMDNEIRSESKWGVAIWAGAKPEVVGNTISSVGTAIMLQDEGFISTDVGPDPVIRGNTIVGSSKGIDAPAGTRATIDTNTFLDNDVAMQLVSPDVTVTGNVIRGGRAGIVTSGDGAPRFEGNDVEGAEARGTAIMRGSPVMTGDRLCGNGENLFVATERAAPQIDETNDICANDVAE